MSKVGEMQKSIVNFVRNNESEEVKRKEIVDTFKHNYYCNGEKHVSDCIHRCVKRGLLKRVRHGWYSLGKMNKSSEPVDPSQTELF
jgi:predicted transcriptional regulator of viral defense system